MRELEGMSHEEIAAALGISGGAARQAIARARAAVRGGFGALVPLPLLRVLAAATRGRSGRRRRARRPAVREWSAAPVEESPRCWVEAVRRRSKSGWRRSWWRGRSGRASRSSTAAGTTLPRRRSVPRLPADPGTTECGSSLSPVQSQMPRGATIGPRHLRRRPLGWARRRTGDDRGRHDRDDDHGSGGGEDVDVAVTAGGAIDHGPGSRGGRDLPSTQATTVAIPARPGRGDDDRVAPAADATAERMTVPAEMDAPAAGRVRTTAVRRRGRDRRGVGAGSDSEDGSGSSGTPGGLGRDGSGVGLLRPIRSQTDGSGGSGHGTSGSSGGEESDPGATRGRSTTGPWLRSAMARDRADPGATTPTRSTGSTSVGPTRPRRGRRRTGADRIALVRLDLRRIGVFLRRLGDLPRSILGLLRRAVTDPRRPLRRLRIRGRAGNFGRTRTSP